MRSGDSGQAKQYTPGAVGRATFCSCHARAAEADATLDLNLGNVLKTVIAKSRQE
jgi:hypothetical protein